MKICAICEKKILPSWKYCETCGKKIKRELLHKNKEKNRKNSKRYRERKKKVLLEAIDIIQKYCFLYKKDRIPFDKMADMLGTSQLKVISLYNKRYKTPNQ